MRVFFVWIHDFMILLTFILFEIHSSFNIPDFEQQNSVILRENCVFCKQPELIYLANAPKSAMHLSKVALS